MLLFTIIYSSLSAFLSYIYKLVLDTALYGQDFFKLKKYIFIYIGFTVLSFIVSFFSKYYGIMYPFKFSIYFKERVLDKLFRRSIRYFTDQKSGDLLLLVASDTEKISNFIFDDLFNLLSVIISFAFYVIILFKLDYKLFLLLLIVQPLVFLIQHLTSPVIKKYSEENRKLLGEASTTIQDMMNNTSNVILLGISGFLSSKFIKELNVQYNSFKKLIVVSNISTCSLQLLSSVNLCIIVFVGGFKVVSGEMPVGTLSVFMTLGNSIITPMIAIMSIKNLIAGISPFFERVNDILIFDDVLNEDKLECHDIKTLTADNISFAYDTDNLIIQDASYTFSAGRSYGIVGTTGEGKSTFVKLIMGILKPNSGTVLVNGIETREFSEKSILSKITYINQESFFSNDSIRTNIIFDKIEKLDDKDLYSALKEACIMNEISAMDDKLDTFMSGNGQTFSGGQKQRIALARAFIYNTPVVILDEPTAAVDIETRDNIIDSVMKKFKNSILIIISHDMDVIKRCDEKLKISNRKIIPF